MPTNRSVCFEQLCIWKYGQSFSSHYLDMLSKRISSHVSHSSIQGCRSSLLHWRSSHQAASEHQPHICTRIYHKVPTRNHKVRLAPTILRRVFYHSTSQRVKFFTSRSFLTWTCREVFSMLEGFFCFTYVESDKIFIITDLISEELENAHGHLLKILRNKDYEIIGELLNHLPCKPTNCFSSIPSKTSVAI